MKRILSVLCLASLAACGGGGGGGSPMPVAIAPIAAQAPKPDCSVELNGDSIMWGQSVPPGATTIQRLASPPAVTLKRIRPSYTVVDKSVGGQMATERAAVFNNDTRNSRIIVIQHGTNDLYRGNVADMVVALKSMVTYAQAERRTVILTGMSTIASTLYPEFRDAVKQVAVDTGAVYADWPSVAVVTTDAAHPDQASSEALVAKLALSLDAIAPECKS